MEVVIIADGSNEMGYGHLTRSNAIAVELINQGELVTYLSRTPEAVSAVCHDQVAVHDLDQGTRTEVVQRLESINPDVAYIDLPEIPCAFQQAVRSVCPLGVFLGGARHQLCCDMLVNGHIFAKEEEYEWIGEEPVWCVGPEYLPLRQPFPEMTNRNKDCSRTPEEGIILMGGTDPHNITPRVMKAFQPLNVEVTVIVGPGNENVESIRKTKTAIDDDFSIEKNPSDLAERMFNADIAVSGFGTTVYELMATQTPFVGITRNRLETVTAERVSDCMTVDYLGRQFIKEDLISILTELQDDSEKRNQLQNEYQELVDGKGPKRIVNNLLSLVE